jgi:hypothetical protein
MPDEGDPPLSEPVIVMDIFVSGFDLERLNGDIRLTGWVTHEEEHRIVARLVIPDGTCRALARDLRKALASDRN